MLQTIAMQHTRKERILCAIYERLFFWGSAFLMYFIVFISTQKIFGSEGSVLDSL